MKKNFYNVALNELEDPTILFNVSDWAVRTLLNDTYSKFIEAVESKGFDEKNFARPTFWQNLESNLSKYTDRRDLRGIITFLEEMTKSFLGEFPEKDATFHDPKLPPGK
jgi:hypothetical protein